MVGLRSHVPFIAQGSAWDRAALVAALWGVACGGVAVETDVVYDARHGLATAMDIYSPDEPAAPRSRGAVLLVHGGGWRSGSKRHYERAADRLARSGYVAASINYRLVPDGRYPNAVRDVMCALSFLRQRDDLGVDPERVAAMGYSAGGHLVALVGVAGALSMHQADCAAGPTGPPAAVISGAGVHDLADLKFDAAADFVGGSGSDLADRLALASPLTYARAPGDRTFPPFLLIHGGGDFFVPVEQSQAMRDALRAAGGGAHLLERAGGGHLLNASADPGVYRVGVADDTPEAWIAIGDLLRRTIEHRGSGSMP